MNTIKTITLSLLSLLSITLHAQSFKEPIAYKLNNGMNIIISENNSSPKAYASFTLDKNAYSNKKDGIVELLNAVLNESIGKSNNLIFKDNSGKLATAADGFDKELNYMASLLQNAGIDEKTFNTAKTKLLLSLKLQDYDYDQTVNNNSINNLTFADVKDFYNQISPEKTFLTIAGDIDLISAKASAKKAFGNWNNSNKQKHSVATIAK
ncbi:insulinase family protein [Pedobacter agri]|uniref:insulinase family protein n=1 Tax=Pedobacter agri TaxID=454586 RepID=UPI00293009E4|nr:insulinase family protein [Pedobacter agri]